MRIGIHPPYDKLNMYCAGFWKIRIIAGEGCMEKHVWNMRIFDQRNETNAQYTVLRGDQQSGNDRRGPGQPLSQ